MININLYKYTIQFTIELLHHNLFTFIDENVFVTHNRRLMRIGGGVDMKIMS